MYTSLRGKVDHNLRFAQPISVDFSSCSLIQSFVLTIDGGNALINTNEPSPYHRPALCILEIMISIIVQNEIKR